MTTKVSSKNQIVIPKAIRTQAGIGPHTMLYPSVNSNGDVVLSKTPRWSGHGGKLRGVWTKHGDPAELLRTERDREA